MSKAIQEIVADLRKADLSGAQVDAGHIADQIELAFTELEDKWRQCVKAAAKLGSSPTGERLSTVGAETCEALEDIFLICCKAGSTIGYDVACGCIKSKARHALSSLARNFDWSAYAETVRQAWLEDEMNWDEFGSPKLELHEWILSRGTERKGDGDGKSK